MTDLSKITKDGKAFYLAYDQGMEHGPADFDSDNVDPQKIIGIAASGYFTGVIFQKGIAEKYYTNTEFAQKVPLILKLNGKTNLVQNMDPYSPQICSVDEAIQIGASAVGYTIYVGSNYESKMFEEFSQIEQEAHAKNLPLIGWMYIKGSGASGRDLGELSAYAARLGLEMGADIIKIKYPENEQELKWAVEAAGKTKVVVSGGIRETEEIFLNEVKSCMNSGCSGMAVGRNIWQSDNPLAIAEKIHNIIWS